MVKTYLKPGARGRRILRWIEEGLGHLLLLCPMPEFSMRSVREKDWAGAWKKHYKPLRIEKRVLLTPAWEEPEVKPDDLMMRLEPGMAFGTGLHPTTRLCVAALKEQVRPNEALLDVGSGSSVLAIASAKLGASPVWATDIDPLDREGFYTLLEVRVLTERYRRTYNQVRPHSSLGYRPPAPQALWPADPVLALIGLT